MPKYPFSPEILDAMPEELAELMRGLELTLLQEICSRLNISDNLNEVTERDIKALRDINLDEVKKAIQETIGISRTKLNNLLSDVVKRNQRFYTELADLAHVTAPAKLIDEADIAAIGRQTLDAYRNLTASMGFLVDNGRTMLPPTRAYQWALDSAAMQMEAGTVGYNQAIANAVKQLADSGLKTVDYESGHIDQADVAVRRAVLTGVNQLNQKYREQSMEYLGTDLVETTAHRGARDKDGPMGWENHKAWQGKVYRWRRYVRGENSSPAYPKDVTKEYLDAATPAQGTITYDEGYKVKGHRAEIDMAEWLNRTFGGDIRVLKEINKENIQTPDYFWREKLWDLKTVSTEKSANSAVRHGLQQIRENPGGIILDYRGKNIDLGVVQSVVDKRMQWRRDKNIVDIIVVFDDICHIWRY